MLSVGDRIPEAGIWLGPQERLDLPEVVERGPALLFFYLFDWSST